MATFARHVDVEWKGGLMDGSGTAAAGTGCVARVACIGRIRGPPRWLCWLPQ